MPDAKPVSTQAGSAADDSASQFPLPPSASKSRTVDEACVLIPLAPGEVLDRLTILQLKLDAARTDAQRAQLHRERTLLEDAWSHQLDHPPTAAPEWTELLEVNGRLWRLEDEVRAAERLRQFDSQFIESARSIYRENDHRAHVKRAVNLRLGSALSDIKLYESSKEAAT